MSLSLKTIDRLFDRLTATYGREFMMKFDGIDPNSVKSSWAHELSAFSSHLDMIAWALENLPEKCPNVIQFRNIAKQAPRQSPPALLMPDVLPERIKSEIGKLMPMLKKSSFNSSGKDWAHRILGRYEAGESIAPCTLRFAREALGQTGK